MRWTKDVENAELKVLKATRLAVIRGKTNKNDKEDKNEEQKEKK